MKKFLAVSALATATAFGAVAAQAQESSTPMSQHEAHHAGDNAGQMMGQGMMGQGAMGPGMMGQGSMGPGMMGAGGMQGGAIGMMGPHMSKMMLVMMDTDGNGSLSLEEVQAVHERMFKAMDADDDGQLSASEMASFCGGQASQSE
ncbi:EF-hand domain-containing protein [Afifella sp. YEN Y35]|uniref:EF-hand domain-containing protein n=1 Tax=Afifella sp. YEN Y35 TaxID=3388337 RepID=UPI0039E0EE9A